MNVAVILNETEGFDLKGLPITPSNKLNANAGIRAKIAGYKRIDPTRYEVEVQAEKPSILASCIPFTSGSKSSKLKSPDPVKSIIKSVITRRALSSGSTILAVT